MSLAFFAALPVAAACNALPERVPTELDCNPYPDIEVSDSKIFAFDQLGEADWYDFTDNTPSGVAMFGVKDLSEQPHGERCGATQAMVIDSYGYNDWGECFTFADPQEVWFFEILGPGRGKVGAVWAAVRLPDDQVAVSANSHRIRQIDLSDPDHYMASENVFSLAREMGWWDPDDGEPFEFCYAYADRNSMFSRRREWRALSLLAPSLGLDPNAENFPLSVKPERQVTVQDLLAIFRDAYEDTPYDMTRRLTVVDRQGQTVKSPVANPFMNADLRELLGVERERTIASPTATYVQITQSRSWLPDPIGGVVWLGYDNPATTPHLPFYIGISQMPASYLVDGRRAYRRESAWWAFRRATKLSYFRYQDMKAVLREVWEPIERDVFARQASMEEEALRLYREDPARAEGFLTAYCHDVANRTVERYWQLGDELWTRFNNAF